MLNTWVVGIALFTVGVAMLYRNMRLFYDDERLMDFIIDTRRGRAESAKVGVERAKERLRAGYLKVGMAVGMALLVAGLLHLSEVVIPLIVDSASSLF